MNAIAVIGPWRGGTSLVTAILESLGVFIGERFVDARTGYCTCEDLGLRRACLACFDERPGRWCYYGTHSERVARLRAWLQWAHQQASALDLVACGGKHPVMCKLVDELAEAWRIDGVQELTLVSVVRTPAEIHRSWTRPQGAGGSHWWPRWDREYVVDDLIASRDASLAKKPHLQVDFKQLRRHPLATVRMIAEACNLPDANVPKAADLVLRRSQMAS